MSDLMKAKEYFLSCVACAVNSVEPQPVPDDVDEKIVYNLCVRNNAQVMLYFVNESKRIFSDEVSLKLKKAYQAAMLREMSQQAEIEKIRRDFTDSKIPFMFLKGTHLKSLYPKPEMRFMVDMDVLVKKEDVGRAREILLAHGLRQRMDNGKDIVLIKEPFLTVELHNTLFTEDNYMYEYFLPVWDSAVKVDEYEYAMSEAELEVYVTAHLAEHYTSAGACFRPMIDLYLFDKKVAPKFDDDTLYYRNSRLSELGLSAFFENVLHLGCHIFEGEMHCENTELMENYIVFGPPVKNANEAASAAQTDDGKAKRILKMLFPNLRHMQNLFPVLKKLPFLLPLFWVIRFFKNAFTKKAREKLKAVSSTDTEETRVLKKIYEDSGITKY